MQSVIFARNHSRLLDRSLFTSHRRCCSELSNQQKKIHPGFNNHLYFLNHSTTQDLPRIRSTEARINESELRDHNVLRSALVEAYTRCNARDDAERAFRLFETPSSKLWQRMIECDLRHDDPSKANQRLKQMMDANIEPQTFIWDAFLNFYKNKNQLNKAYDLLCDSSQSKYPPQRENWFKLLWAFGKNDQLHAEMMTYRKMRSLGITLDLSSWNSLLASIGKKGDVDGVQTLFDEMKSANVEPDVVTWNSVLNTLRKAKRIDKMTNLMEEMKSRDIDQDRVTWSVYLSALGEANRIDEMLAKLNEAKLEIFHPDPWNAVLECLGRKRKIEEMMSIFGAMERSGVTPDHVTWSTLLHSLGTAGKLKEMFDLFRQIKDVVISPVPWNAVLSILGKNVANVDLTLSVFNEMKTSSALPNHVTYIIMISMLSQANKEEEMEKFISEGKSRFPEISEYGISQLRKKRIQVEKKINLVE
eukprot:TRINITY_DN6613_c0_g1_i3.p1 TRINITY_DN6613_c0_g1~~TRINITY_DN6613_c0_g1_i3.p1  ORF type:complete len:474 (+),score=127.22 TRINITY_DN6613_c0_g1_i3:171-1592(+)